MTVSAQQTLQATRRLTQTEAIVEAMAEEMRRDPTVFFIGQDVGEFGGSMQGSQGLWAEFGPKRIREAPISESAMVGAAIGAALFGRRPIVEVSFGEFLPAAMNQLINQAPNLHYMTGGAAKVPVVIRTRVGDGPYGGHPQDYSVWFAYVPGLKVVMPGTPSDAKGLLLSAIRDDNPVLYIEPMSLAHGPREEVPAGEYLVPIGKARVAREGTDLTIVTVGSTVPVVLRAASLLEQEGVDAEVIDLRTLSPLDTDTIVESVRKTGGLVTVHESWVSWRPSWPSGPWRTCWPRSSVSAPGRSRSRAARYASTPSRPPSRWSPPRTSSWPAPRSSVGEHDTVEHDTNDDLDRAQRLAIVAEIGRMNIEDPPDPETMNAQLAAAYGEPEVP
jgi:pyruvate/2-oxoglutarate/acetoin dehydrogenase E1 component